MEDDGDVLARLHDLVEIADAAVPHRACERSVGPPRLSASQQIAPGEIGPPSGRRDKPRSSAGRRARLPYGATNRVLPHPVGPLSMQRQAMSECVLEQQAFMADGAIERNFGVGFRAASDMGDLRKGARQAGAVSEARLGSRTVGDRRVPASGPAFL